MDSVFTHVLDDDEIILWQEKPYFLLFVFNFQHLLVGFGALFLYLIFGSNQLPALNDIALFILLVYFFAPIIYLAAVYPNTFYAITNRRVMLRGGFFGVDYSSIDYDSIQTASVNVNPLEKIFRVGTIQIYSGQRNHKGTDVAQNICAIPFPYETYKKMKSTAVDIKSDISYPNKLRPEDNPGYNSKYKK
jgi:membrane protein YdbS with pleckstrin-like domain